MEKEILKGYVALFLAVLDASLEAETTYQTGGKYNKNKPLASPEDLADSVSPWQHFCANWIDAPEMKGVWGLLDVGEMQRRMNRYRMRG